MLRAFLDGQVFGEQDGDGPSHVVALHGWARDRHDFAGVLDGYNALRLDLPGFGSTPIPSAAPTPQRVADLIAPLVESLFEPRILIGHSFGGRVAVHLAAAGLNIQHMILIGTPLLRVVGETRPKVTYRVLRRANAVGLVSEGAMERARRRYGSSDYRQATGVMRGALVASVNEDYRTMLPSIETPVALITGEHDTAAPPAVQRSAAELLPRAEVTVLAKAGHLIENAHEVAVRRELRKVLGA